MSEEVIGGGLRGVAADKLEASRYCAEGQVIGLAVRGLFEYQEREGAVRRVQ